MKRVVKEAMGDCSTVEEFRFLVRCQECGGIWHSSPIRFSKAGAEPEPEGMRTILRTLYEREREAAGKWPRQRPQRFSTIVLSAADWCATDAF